jgi:predicted porin
MKLKEGTKVKCIRNTFVGLNDLAYPYLTVGKTYTVMMDFGPTLAMIADNGNGVSLLKDLFLTLEDYRDKQIEKIFEKNLVD